MHLRSPLARARGLGSAKDGTRLWWAQRLTAVALVPLGVLFVFAVIAMSSAGYDEARTAMSHPLIAALWVLFLITLLQHAQLGLQVIVEDYVHDERLKLGSIIAVKFAVVLLGAVSILAVLRIAFGS